MALNAHTPVDGVNLVNCPASTATTLKTATGAGAAGDWLGSLTIVPTTTSPGAVTLGDGSTTYNIFAGGAASLSNLAPVPVSIGGVSVNGAWIVTVGAGMSVLANGQFS